MLIILLFFVACIIMSCLDVLCLLASTFFSIFVIGLIFGYIGVVILIQSPVLMLMLSFLLLLIIFTKILKTY